MRQTFREWLWYQYLQEGRRRKQERKRERHNQGASPTTSRGKLSTWCSGAKMAWESGLELGRDYQLFRTPVCLYPRSSVKGCWLQRSMLSEVKVWSWNMYRQDSELTLLSSCQKTFMEGRPGDSSEHLHRAPLGKSSEDWLAPFSSTHRNVTDNPNTVFIIRFFKASCVKYKYRWPTWFTTMRLTIQSRSFLQAFYNFIN